MRIFTFPIHTYKFSLRTTAYGNTKRSSKTCHINVLPPKNRRTTRFVCFPLIQFIPRTDDLHYMFMPTPVCITNGASPFCFLPFSTLAL